MNENSMALAKGTGTSVKDLGSVEDVDAMNRQSKSLYAKWPIDAVLTGADCMCRDSSIYTRW